MKYAFEIKDMLFFDGMQVEIENFDEVTENILCVEG